MPTQLLAGKRDNVQTLDLTRLATSSNNSEVIDRGDVIEVSISAGLDEKDTVTLPVRVNEQGIASIPEIGPVPLAGMEMEAAEAVIVATCIERGLYRRPNVTVTMKRQRMNRVMVVGAVKKPDIYEIPRGRSDLLAAIVAAGGLADDAGTNVEIRNPRRLNGGRSSPVASGRGTEVDIVGHSSPLRPTDSVPADGEGDRADAGDAGDAGNRGTNVVPVVDADGKMESFRVDLVSATKTGRGGYLVEDGGVVSVEKRDPEPLHVIGLVRKPDRYDFPIAEDLRVTDAIALAGGTSISLADRVFVVRRVPKSSETAVIQVSLREAKRNARANIRLEPGDVVSVEETPGTVLYQAFQIIRFNVGMAVPAAGVF
jgi:polysaccharide export outer membrane protein